MNLLDYFFIFLIGLAIGSFFNVVIFRFNTNESFVKGRSRCLNCGSNIKWFDMIPVISYFLLKRRCRKCQVKISPLYPLVEFLTALILLLWYFNIRSLSLPDIINVFIILIFVLIFFLDFHYFIIPDKILALLVVLLIILKTIATNVNFYQLLISTIGLTSFFVIIFLVSKGKWIGLGDIKLIFIIGFLLGYPASFLCVLGAVWVAAVFSIILLIFKRANLKTEIPFGAFLSIFTIIFLIYNNELQKISEYFYW
jgi:prepilin signal peptidase PulO-like enzyme (type II secretory pathway)